MKFRREQGSQEMETAAAPLVVEGVFNGARLQAYPRLFSGKRKSALGGDSNSSKDGPHLSVLKDLTEIFLSTSGFFGGMKTLKQQTLAGDGVYSLLLSDLGIVPTERQRSFRTFG